MSAIAATLAEIRNGPDGPEIGAFFDFDGTIIEGYSVMTFYEDRFRNFEIGPEEATRTDASSTAGLLSRRRSSCGRSCRPSRRHR